MPPDDDLLEIAVNRKEALEALAAGPHHRQELQEALGVSKTTCHRIVRTFDDRDIVHRTSSGYALTAFGQIVADQATRFGEHIGTATGMQPLLNLFDSWDGEFNAGVFAVDEVDWEVRADQSFSIDRGVDRVEGTELLRVLDWTPVPDLYHEKILSILAANEAKVESIYPKSEVKDRLDRFPDLHDELLEAGAGPRYWVYEDVPPWGMSIYDDTLVELRAYEQQSGAYVMDAVTETPKALNWALDVFADYRERAEPLTEIDDLPDWGDYSW